MTAYFITVDEIMVTWCASRTYVYKLASENRWRRYRDEERRTHYRIEDVADTFSNINRSAA